MLQTRRQAHGEAGRVPGSLSRSCPTGPESTYDEALKKTGSPALSSAGPPGCSPLCSLRRCSPPFPPGFDVSGRAAVRQSPSRHRLFAPGGRGVGRSWFDSSRACRQGCRRWREVNPGRAADTKHHQPPTTARHDRPAQGNPTNHPGGQYQPPATTLVGRLVLPWPCGRGRPPGDCPSPDFGLRPRGAYDLLGRPLAASAVSTPSSRRRGSTKPCREGDVISIAYHLRRGVVK